MFILSNIGHYITDLNTTHSSYEKSNKSSQFNWLSSRTHAIGSSRTEIRARFMRGTGLLMQLQAQGSRITTLIFTFLSFLAIGHPSHPRLSLRQIFWTLAISN